jgi:hypothetical protein
VNPGKDDRAGRWVGGQRKTECGIHFLSTAHKQSGTP